ncbi:MAG: electron transfer flavoprotein subunit beta/FixA family protein [Desulfobacterota bacterium]|nr:electron transfer flavoprotein subunit beta/FixA family protein [Thermodesulfobacteriota bacterium]
MNIVVCVKQVLDPEIPPAKFKIDPATKQVIPPPGVPPVISVYDERAVEVACRLKDKHKGKITVLSLGSAKAADVIRHAISMGADEGYVLSDPAFENLDSFGTAHVLSKAIQKIGAYDLVLCGRQAADWGDGQVGPILAELLGLPLITIAASVEAVEKTVRVKRMVSDGYEVLEAPMPCLVTVSSEVGLPRLPGGMGLMMARKKQIPTWKAQDIGVDPSQLDKGKAHMEVIGLSVPTRKTQCEIIAANTPAEAGVALAEKIAKLI